jgi:hypothetical protein
MPDAVVSPVGNRISDAFAAALLDPDVAIPDFVTGPEGKSAPKRFAVYRNNVVVSLMEALASAFPSVAAIMGEETFRRIARNYVAFHPPRSAMMQRFGDTFPQFLAGFAPLRNAPFLADVARAERAFLDAWHAADDVALDPVRLSGLANEEVMALTFAAHRATAIISSQFAVADLFAWRNGRPKDGTDVNVAQALLITRPQLEVMVQPLTPVQAAFLTGLMAGQALGEAAEAALGKDDGFDLGGTLALALQAGLFRET